MLKRNCHRKGCNRIRSEFSLFLNRRCPPCVAGQTYCSDSCLLAQVEQDVAGKWDLVHGQRALKIPRPKIGTILLQSQYLTREQLDAAIAMQLSSHEGRLGEVLVRLGYVEERQITLALAKQWGLPLIDLRHCEVQPGAVKSVPGKVATCGKMLPVGYDGSRGALRIAVSSPMEPASRAALGRMLQREIVPYIADSSAVREMIQYFYPSSEIDTTACATFASREELLALIRQAAISAIRERAENIQFELLEDYSWVRIDYIEMSRHAVFRHAMPCYLDPVTAQLKPQRLAYAAVQ
jgi:hypothetical protein